MRTFLLTFLAFVIATSSLFAQDEGDLDVSFSVDGYTTFAPGPLHDAVNEIIALPNGKILFAGQSNVNSTSFSSLDVKVGRLKQNGELDSTFATNGFYTLTNAAASDFAYNMYVLSDGKILIAGGYSITEANTAYLAIRLNADGSPDDSFGSNGVVVYDVDAGEDYCKAIMIQNDGSLILVGNSAIPGFTYNRIALVKLDADGNLVTSFGTGGEVMYSPNSTPNFEVFEALQEQDNIYICGRSYNSDAFTDYPYVAKFSSAGVLASSFGTNGIYVATTAGLYASIITEGSVLHLGGTYTNNGQALITAMNFDGTLVSSFGTNGTVTLSQGGISEWTDINYDIDGKILACGVKGTGIFDRQLMAARFTDNGVLDPGFATNGVFSFDLGTFFDIGNSIDVQADGKVIVGGQTASTNNDMLLLRLFKSGVILPLTGSTLNVGNTLCSNSADGTAEIEAIGGEFPYTYFLDNGTVDVGPNLTGLSAGNHTVLITDAAGTTTTVNFAIAAAPVLTLEATSSNNDVNATAIGGTPPYSYTLGDITQDNGVFLDLANGDYVITVVDANGCTTTANANVLSSSFDVQVKGFEVLPTISNGQFKVINKTNKAGQLRVVNALGQTVHTDNWEAGNASTLLQLSHLQTGYYWIMMNNEAVKICIAR